MHVLMLTPSLPFPLHQGGAIRNFGLLRGLRDAGHQVTLLSFHEENGVDPADTPLAQLCEQVETVLAPTRTRLARLRDLFLTGIPDLARRLASDDFRQKLEALLRDKLFDLVQFEGLEMAGYLPVVRHVQPEAKLCYDAHNAEHALQRDIFEVEIRNPKRWAAAAYSLAQARRIMGFEREICRQADCVIAVSDEDAALLRPLRAPRDVAVVPNGISVDDYRNGRPALDLGEHVLVFTGKMDYRPNIDAMRWFTEAVLPLVQQQVPGAQLYIVGQKPHASLERLREKPGVHLTGWVEDVQPFLHAADVYVAPLRMGSGTRLKILEAMASGCAVVATPVAASGLAADVRQSLLLADDETAFAGLVASLLTDPERRQALGEAARADVRRVYDWSALIPCLLKTYQDIGLG